MPPLSASERTRLADRAARLPWIAPATPRRRPAVAHPLGVQTLLVTLADGKRVRLARQRSARVFQFDHARGLARRLDLTMPAMELLGSIPLSSVHLPLNETERRWAHARVMAAQPSIGAGERWSAFVHEPVHPDEVCRRERCALVSRHGPDGEVLAGESVVHFADGRVHDLVSADPR